MRQLIFALQFRGTAAPVAGAAGKLAAKTTARSQVHRTAIDGKGVQAGLESSAGGSAVFESQVEMLGEGTFLESGTIRYGKAGTVSFKTVGRGVLGPSGIEGLQRGAVIWEVTGGEGQLAGASGLITSNFTVGAKGEVVDNHFAQLFLPGGDPVQARTPTAKKPHAAAEPSRGRARKK
jgi:hypothetical protein